MAASLKLAAFSWIGFRDSCGDLGLLRGIFRLPLAKNEKVWYNSEVIDEHGPVAQLVRARAS